MALGRAGGTADTVTAGATAQQDHHVTGGGTLTAHVLGRGGGDNRAALQTLGHEALVVQLRHVAGGQTNLVAVGGIACGGGLADLALGQFACQGLGHGLAGVTGTGDAHGLMHVGTTGQRIADATADTGGGTAERLDLGGVVVGLVLKHQKPILLLTIHRGGEVDGTGVDLLGLVQFGG